MLSYQSTLRGPRNHSFFCNHSMQPFVVTSGCLMQRMVTMEEIRSFLNQTRRGNLEVLEGTSKQLRKNDWSIFWFEFVYSTNKNKTWRICASIVQNGRGTFVLEWNFCTGGVRHFWFRLALNFMQVYPWTICISDDPATWPFLMFDLKMTSTDL